MVPPTCLSKKKLGGWANPLQTLPQGLVFTFDFDFDPDPELDINKSYDDSVKLKRTEMDPFMLG